MEKDLTTILQQILSVMQDKENKGIGVITLGRLQEILGVGKTTLEKYRREGWIGYTQVGDKIWFTEKDVLDFLNHPSHRHNPYIA